MYSSPEGPACMERGNRPSGRPSLSRDQLFPLSVEASTPLFSDRTKTLDPAANAGAAKQNMDKRAGSVLKTLIEHFPVEDDVGVTLLREEELAVVRELFLDAVGGDDCVEVGAVLALFWPEYPA